ncbi:MAG: hypothetical protein ACOX88_03755 [Christensenellales bacterium]|jgi:hypothetical protein
MPPFVAYHILGQRALSLCTQYNATAARAYPALYAAGTQGLQLLWGQCPDAPDLLVLSQEQEASAMTALLEDLLAYTSVQCDMRTAYAMGFAAHIRAAAAIEIMVRGKKRAQKEPALDIWAGGVLAQDMNAGQIPSCWKMNGRQEKVLLDTLGAVARAAGEDRPAKQVKAAFDKTYRLLKKRGFGYPPLSLRSGKRKEDILQEQVQRQVKASDKRGVKSQIKMLEDAARTAREAIDTVTHCSRGEIALTCAVKFFTGT